MILCVCNRVSDRKVREAIHQGASSVAEVSTRCGIGSDCGGCVELVEAMLEAAASRPAPPPVADCQGATQALGSRRSRGASLGATPHEGPP